MIKQDYLIRMIQSIIAAIAEMLLQHKKVRKQEWSEYDSISRQILGCDVHDLAHKSNDELRSMCNGTPDQWDKIELIAMQLLRMAQYTSNDWLTQTRLKQQGIDLLKEVQTSGPIYSIQRKCLIKLMEFNQ